WQFIAPVFVCVLEPSRIRPPVSRRRFVDECSQLHDLEGEFSANCVHFLATPDGREQIFVALADPDCDSDILHVCSKQLADRPFKETAGPACSARDSGGRETSVTRKVGKALV